MANSNRGKSAGCWIRTSTAPRTWRILLANRGGDLSIPGQVAANHLNVERRRQAEVDRLADDVGRQKIESGARKLAIEREAQIREHIPGLADDRRCNETMMSASAGPTTPLSL